MYTDILNNNLGESGYREISAVTLMRFYGEQTPFLFASLKYYSTFSPKKLTPEERLRRYIKWKYGDLNNKVKKEKSKDKL